MDGEEGVVQDVVLGEKSVVTGYGVLMPRVNNVIAYCIVVGLEVGRMDGKVDVSDGIAPDLGLQGVVVVSGVGVSVVTESVTLIVANTCVYC